MTKITLSGNVKDILITNPQNDQALIYSGGYWVNKVISGISSGGGHVIQDEGTPLTQRSKLNFVGSNITVTDDVANDRTIVTVSGIIPSSGGGDMFKAIYDTNNNSIVDNSEKLGGQLPAYYSISGHIHDDRYYTETELQTPNSSQVHWDNVIGKPLFDVYFKDSPSTISGYSLLVPTVTSGVEDDDEATVNSGSGEVLIDAYASELVTPTAIDAGTWVFNIWRNVSSSVGDSRIVIRVYKRTGTIQRSL